MSTLAFDMEVHMRARFLAALVMVLACLLFLCCGEKPSQPASTSPGTAPAAVPAPAAPAAQPGAQPSAAQPNAPAQHATTTIPKPAAAPVVLPAGTVLTVRVGQTISSKSSSPGEKFTASVAQPVEVDGKVVIPAGAEATGTVAEAVPLGRFKGGAKLRVTLDSVTIDGRAHPVQAAAVARAAKGKGKRTATMIGGGAGVGAVLGGIFGGGKGAAIGAAAGAGAGTAGAAFTGNKNIVIPAESALAFKLTKPLELK
jgi:hypothetical protein